MQIANRLAGFSLGEADILRRAMGKKNHDEMAAQREKFLAGCATRKVPREKGREDFRSDGGIRRLRLQQIALVRLRVARLPDRVFENALSRRVHGRAAHLGNGQHRKSREVHQRSARHGHHGSSARCQFERSRFHSRWRSDSLRTSRHQERRRKHGQGNSRCARGTRALHFDLPILRSHRHAPVEQARPRKPDQIGRDGFPRLAAIANVRGHRPVHGKGAAPPARKNQRPARPVRRRLGGSRTRRRTVARPRRMARARNAVCGIRDGGLLYFRPSALEISAPSSRSWAPSISPPWKDAGTAKRSPSRASWSPCAACVRAKGSAGEFSRCRT